MKIVFAGGGTLGPVTPLLAAVHALKRLHPATTFAWIGTPDGPERALVEREHIAFYPLPVAKWPRYPSARWLTFAFDWSRARGEAERLVHELKPAAVVTLGGFTAVPVVLAAAKRGIPCLTHQLDLVPGWSNKKIARRCVSVTTSFEYERPPFGDRVSDQRIATPTRFTSGRLPSKHEALKKFGLHANRPTVLVFGGGTGAQRLNEMVVSNKARWLDVCQLIHVTGVGKGRGTHDAPGYAVRPLLDEREMQDAYAAADLVVCRAGMGSLSEIAAQEKAAVLVPIPGHQEANAQAFEDRGAAVVFDQREASFEQELFDDVRLLLKDPAERRGMGERAHAFLPTDDGSELAKRVIGVLGTKS